MGKAQAKGTEAAVVRALELLAAPQPHPEEARGVLKELLVKGVCAGEVVPVRDLAALVVERLIKPMATHSRGREAQVERLLRRIRGGALGDDPGVQEALADVAAWALGEGESSAVEDHPAPSLPMRLLAALRLLGEGEGWVVEAVDQLELRRQEGTLLWEDLHALLGRVVTQGEIARSGWQRERGELLQALTQLAERFGETLQGLGEVDRESGAMVQRLQGASTEADLKALKTLLLQEAGALQKHAGGLRERLAESQAQVTRAGQRLKEMEAELKRTRDQQLLDPFTGLPNRYAFLAHLNRTLERRQHLGEPFVLVAFQLLNLRGLVREHGREGGKRLLLATTQRLHKALEGDGIFLARLGDDLFGLLIAPTDLENARQTVMALAEMLQHTRFKLGGRPLALQAAFGVLAPAQEVALPGPRELLAAANRALEEARELPFPQVQLLVWPTE